MNRRSFLFSSLGLVWAFDDLMAQDLRDSAAPSFSILTGKNSPPLFGINHKLQKEASIAFEKMQKAALQDGIKLFSVSSYRNFNAQLGIWNRKYEKFKAQGFKGKAIVEKIIEYSAFPGASRHHWGTDLDISDLNVQQPGDPLNPKHFKKGGVYYKMYDWMQVHSREFGFYEAYTDEVNRKGFQYEPWHYSYKPLSVEYLKKFKKVDFKKHILNEKIKGFKHMDQAFWDVYMEEYVMGLNKELID